MLLIRYGVDGLGFESLQSQVIFFFLRNHPGQLWGPSSILEVKRPGSEVDRPPPVSVKVKNEWSYTSARPTHLHGMGRDNFTFL